MAWQIIWTPEAEVTFEGIINQLFENWSEREVIRFVNRAYEVIDFIEKQPKQYVYSKILDAHRAIINKQVSLYYRVSDNTIHLLTFWDNRQNPNNLNL